MTTAQKQSYIVTNSNAVRRESFEGREHLVVPVVMVVQGVLQGSDGNVLFPPEEIDKYPAAWNGRPIPVLHPEQNGAQVSANSPDIIEKNTIGSIFNAYSEGGKLKAEAWIDVEKAIRLGNEPLLAQLENGEVVEISTGYFSDLEPKRGAWEGVDYIGVHRNIRPDHLALLPGEVGACSIEDGCGTRVNSKKGDGFVTKLQRAFDTLAEATGLKSNCACGEGEMTDAERLKQAGDKLVANGKLAAKDIEKLQNFDPEQRKMALALMDSMAEVSEPEDGEELNGDGGDGATNEDGQGGGSGEDEEDIVAMSRGKAPKDINKLIANRVDEQVRRSDVVSKLTANAECPFDEKDMAGMSVNHLEKLEKSIRPVDYSGQGGFSANSGTTENVQPMTLNKGVLGGKRKESE